MLKATAIAYVRLRTAAVFAVSPQSSQMRRNRQRFSLQSPSGVREPRRWTPLWRTARDRCRTARWKRIRDCWTLRIHIVDL